TTSCGARESSETVMVALPLLPARSVAITVIVLAPSTSASGALNVPVERSSAAAAPLTVTVTAPSKSPVATALGSATTEPSVGAENVGCGAVLSMLTMTVVEASLPARSTAVPVTFSPSPSAVSVTAGEQAATPLPTSLQVKLTVTSLLFHPAALGAGESVP